MFYTWNFHFPSLFDYFLFPIFSNVHLYMKGTWQRVIKSPEQLCIVHLNLWLGQSVLFLQDTILLIFELKLSNAASKTVFIPIFQVLGNVIVLLFYLTGCFFVFLSRFLSLFFFIFWALAVFFCITLQFFQLSFHLLFLSSFLMCHFNLSLFMFGLLFCYLLDLKSRLWVE
jgi:hypothetical protein